jgi:catechol 1,2-dioxygenase
MAEYTQQQLLDLVNSSQVNPGNDRVRQITQRIVSDLFRAIDDLDIKPDEFWAGVDWLARLGGSGQLGLITAGLGFDRLIDIREEEADEAAGRAAGTPRAIEGPLYIAGAPLSDGEARLDEDPAAGTVLVMEGQVRDVDGNPVADYHLRRKIKTDAQGRYRFRSFIPPGYAIPPNSPTSELFGALGRHGNRPAHIHFLVAADGQRTLTTQVNIPGDTFLDDDFAFATRDGLVVELQPNTPAAGYESLGVNAPFTRVCFDFVLQPALDADEARPQARMDRATA